MRLDVTETGVVVNCKMNIIRKSSVLLAISLMMLVFAPVNAKSSSNSGHLFFCNNESRSWTLYESAQPELFHQEISMQGPGSFTLNISPNGFIFDGFSYTKSTAWDKWNFVSQIKGRNRSWQLSWRIIGDEQRLGLLQLIKSANVCRGCNFTMTMTSSNCKRNPVNTRNRGSSKPCERNYCYTGKQGLYGIPTCIRHDRWDGSRCPF